MDSRIDFSSVWAKVSRAEDHIGALEKEIKSWVDSDPYSATKKNNADFTRYWAILHVKNRPDLVRWSLIASDAIHNLRCSLDHLVYALAVFRTRGGLKNTSA